MTTRPPDTTTAPHGQRPRSAPPFAYYGGKTTLAARIVDALPGHRHYVEPFAGSLAVLLAKPPALFETVNDLDQHVMTFWRVLRDRGAELARVCYLTPHSRAEHQACHDQPVNAGDTAQPDGPVDPSDELEVARRVWVMLTQGRGGTLRKTGWRHFQNPGSRGPTSIPDYLTAYVERMAPAIDRLRRVSLECRPTLEVTRTATDGTRNTNSLLYGAAWRAARALGYCRLITYTQASEPGTSLRAAGWRAIAERPAHKGWHRPSRPRNGTYLSTTRTLWEAPA